MSERRSIAIVGLAGRFPGAPDVGSLWENVVANRWAARDADGRWPVPAADVVDPSSGGRPDRARSSRACLLDDFELDAAGLALPAEWRPRLSRLARLTIQVGADAWRSTRGRRVPARASVILANIALPTDGASRIAEALLFGPADSAIEGRAGAPAIEPLDAFPSALPAGMLARALGLAGELHAGRRLRLVDYAIHLACADLEAERVDAVLCGGVSLPQSIYTQVGFTQLQALSQRGVCAPYDEAADGLVVGEGAAMVVLKRLGDAQRDGDDVLAVIRGIGLSNDVGGSLLSPETEGQVRAMRAAYEQAGWGPDEVDLIEGHGTGTPRGDAVEVASLTELWRGLSARGCVLGSVKSNVGHLLTAAGAAGLCKVLGALREKHLPPSANAPNPIPSLRESPFRLLSSAEPWEPRGDGRPRRAAVSGFGFGGINAHLLLEQPDERVARSYATSPPRAQAAPCPVAIVGMAAHFGRLDSLAAFRDALLVGRPVDDELPPERWPRLDAGAASGDIVRLRLLRGAWIGSVALPAGRFKLPPRDVPSLLPQQILMLKVAGEALDDARPLGKGPHPRAGVVVGIGLDLESTSFHLRWLARERVRRWARTLGIDLHDDEANAWAEEVKDALASPLDAIRTLGALGGIVPSRVAREFQLGGPSFAVADDQASGLRAVEVAVRLLQRREVDVMIAGAVDLAGDVRSVVASDRLQLLAPSSRARPFDARAEGAKVAEGAGAVVLRRLDDALACGDRVYAVVRGLGAAGGAALDCGEEREAVYVRASEAACAEAAIRAPRVGLVEAHGSGVPAEDAVEARALATLFREGEPGGCTTAISSTGGVMGKAGAAAGLASLIRASLALFHQVLPPLGDIETPTSAVDWARTPFHLPRAPEAWVRDRDAGPRLAAVSAMGLDGTCLHAVLGEHDAARVSRDGRRIGVHRAGLFLIGGDRGGDAERAALRDLASRTTDVDALARLWHATRRRGGAEGVVQALVADDVPDLVRQLERPFDRAAVVGGSVAFVFPGSGNHFIGMGRELALALPEVYRRLDSEVARLAGHFQPRWVVPRRTSWPEGWADEARRDLTARVERVMVAQVAHGVAVHDALVHAGLKPDAFLGYSLGESAALLASRTWRDRDLLFERTLSSPLFVSDLCGPRRVLRDAWGEEADWSVVIVTRPASNVRAALVGTAALLIVNAPRECVVGGRSEDVAATVAALRCQAIPLEGVPTVHLPLVEAVRAAYRAHHLLPTTPPPGVRLYSATWAKAYEPTEPLAADSIVECAVRGFDFPALVERAWADGVRIFVEVGPQGSCTRMIGRILEGRPHRAVSACNRGQDGYRTLLIAIARAAEAGAPVDLERLYGESIGVVVEHPPVAHLPPVVVGGARPPLPLRSRSARVQGRPPRAQEVEAVRSDAGVEESTRIAVDSLFRASEATAAAHETFLRVAREGLALQARLLLDRQRALAALGDHATPVATVPRLDRAACLEFAVGKIAAVLGPDFAEVDTFPTRVRLPDEPLMLVDRIVSVEGGVRTLTSGRVVTEHDVLDTAWYLDGGRAPVCISVEAGQADLFLSAYLGIDHETRGERMYRLLDAKVVFHRDLPRPGERIRYDIRIDRFVRQGDTWLFFFRFDGSIDGQPLITMSDGCAGFFSPEQLASGRGIVPRAGSESHGHADGAALEPLVPVTSGPLSDAQVDALRGGDLEGAFGPLFAGKTLAPSLRLPGGRMKLVDRIVALDPSGGPAGLGEVTGEADVPPDAWYLTCHFVDDQVMPGTLMYECCLHTLRVLLLRLGWVSTDAATDACYGPVVGRASALRCRGQVTRETRKVRYRVSVDEIGYAPEPYAIATASMFADDKHVVQMEGMSLKIRGLTRSAVEAEWRHGRSSSLRTRPQDVDPAFTRAQIVAYAEGDPSVCFGPPYAPFRDGRHLARLPRDPFLFLDRVVTVEPPPRVLEPGGWVTCAFDVARDAWYFEASGQATMPFVVLVEAALQSCGWLAAYLGAALTSEDDLWFRNLDGRGKQLAEVGPDAGTLTSRARLTKASRAGGMILVEFDTEVLREGERVYVATTGFGFFPASALASQVGLRGASSWSAGIHGEGWTLARRRPGTPEEAVGSVTPGGLALPATALSMIDGIEILDLHGGPAGLGLVVGAKRVDPAEWFFRAHFYKDPVMPGSLGLEALLELVKVYAIKRFPEMVESHRFQTTAVGRPHGWQYRGQVVPTNEQVRVEARIVAVTDEPDPVIVADGQLAVDGKVIYAMRGFAVRLVRGSDHTAVHGHLGVGARPPAG